MEGGNPYLFARIYQVMITERERKCVDLLHENAKVVVTYSNTQRKYLLSIEKTCLSSVIP